MSTLVYGARDKHERREREREREENLNCFLRSYKVGWGAFFSWGEWGRCKGRLNNGKQLEVYVSAGGSKRDVCFYALGKAFINSERALRSHCETVK